MANQRGMLGLDVKGEGRKGGPHICPQGIKWGYSLCWQKRWRRRKASWSGCWSSMLISMSKLSNYNFIMVWYLSFLWKERWISWGCSLPLWSFEHTLVWILIRHAYSHILTWHPGQWNHRVVEKFNAKEYIQFKQGQRNRFCLRYSRIGC